MTKVRIEYQGVPVKVEDLDFQFEAESDEDAVAHSEAILKALGVIESDGGSAG